jgi:SSS family solute:Na+ symporter
LEEQHELIAAFIIIGLFAAAMSTSDSQLFAMGNEIKGLLGLKEEDNLKPIRIVILLFAVSALVFSLVSSDELVLLARLSFSGTALMGPMILLGVFSNRPQGVAMIILSMVALLLFILSNLGWFPKQILSFRTDLFLMMVLGAAALINYLYLRKK